jgi:hypothetical protein
MSRFVYLSLLLAGTTLAKPWQGIEPGVSKRADVVEKFGEPSKVVKGQGGTETVAYLGEQAIKGTKQAQFRISTASGVVDRIDVFPGPVIDKDAVESTYGPMCASPKDKGPCYQKKLTDDFRTYFQYLSTGLTVFFQEDGKTVHSFVFQPIKGTK